MSVIWQKVWFDLWRHPGRTALAVLSIAAGLFAVGAIFGMLDQLLAGIDRAHQAVAPSHINLILRGVVDETQVERLKETPGVVDIEPVNMLSVRYKTAPEAEWKPGMLVMRRDYTAQTYDVLELKAGEWPQGERIGIERLSSQYFGLESGEQVIFDVRGEERAFEIASLVRHPFVQPPPFGGQAYFFTSAAGLADFGIPEGLYGQLLVQIDSYSYARAQELAGELRERLAQQSVGVVVTLYQDPEQHWGRRFVEGIDLVLQVMAVVSLVLSMVLVMNTTTALITQQTDQIGVIKALGGRRGTILRVYLAGVLVYGLLALLLALPLSLLFAYGSTRWFLNLFNIDYSVFAVSSRAIGLQVAAGLLAPLAAGLWPVWRGAAVTVREALASYGLGGDFGSTRFDRLVEGLGARFLSAPYAIALGNMFRRKARLAMTVTVLAIAGVMFLVVMSLIASTNRTLDNEMARRGYAVRIGFAGEQAAEDVLALAGETAGVAAAEMWYSRNALLLRDGERLQDSAGLGAQLIGLPAGTEMYRPLITAGRWLESDLEREVVINQETAEKNGIAVGDRVSLNLGDLGQAEWTVVGTYKAVYGNGFVVEPFYAPLAAVLEATGRPGQGTQLLLQAGSSDLAGARRVADELQTRFEREGMKVDLFTTSISLEERDFADNQFASVTSVLLNLAMLVATVGGIGLMGALSIGVVERTREIGVMRAIGARSRAIMGLYIMEGIFQGLLSWLLALPVAFVVARPLARLLGQAMLDIDLDFAFHYPSVGVWLVVVLLIAVLASLTPARRAAQISVRENLVYA